MLIAACHYDEFTIVFNANIAQYLNIYQNFMDTITGYLVRKKNKNCLYGQNK